MDVEFAVSDLQHHFFACLVVNRRMAMQMAERAEQNGVAINMNFREHLKYNSYTPLSYLIGKVPGEDMEMMQFLLDRGAVPARDDLATAIVADHAWGYARLLIAHGAPQMHGAHPILSACMYLDNDNKITKLLDVGADINTAGADGRTAIMAAASYPHCMRLLIDRGADVNRADAQGITALMHATHRSLQAVDMLLHAGANVDATDMLGRDAAYHAVESGRDTAILRRLLTPQTVNRKYNNPERTLLLCATDHIDMFMALLSLGADPTDVDSDGRAPLARITDHTYSEQDRWVEAARALIHAGANVNALDRSGEGALEHALRNSNHPMIELLHENGARINNYANVIGPIATIARADHTGLRVRSIIRAHRDTHPRLATDVLNRLVAPEARVVSTMENSLIELLVHGGELPAGFETSRTARYHPFLYQWSIRRHPLQLAAEVASDNLPNFLQAHIPEVVNLVRGFGFVPPPPPQQRR